MRNGLNGALQNVGRTFAGFSAGQKAVTALVVVGLLVGGVLFTRWAGQPTYAPLFTNLSAADASAIVEQLAAEGTPYELADGGATIMVPREDVYDTRLAMSGQGLPGGDGTGYALLDEQGLTTSEFQQQVAYRRALEGELTKTISSIDGVDAAVVHLAIPEKDVFTRETDTPTASVLVETGPGQDLGPQQVRAVVNLVAASVEGMDPDSVTVADSSGRVLSTSDEGGGAAGDMRAQQTRAYEDRVSTSLQEMLDRVVGSGNSVVRLTADLDFDQTETTTEGYEGDPDTPPLAESTTTENYTGGGVPTGGVLGPDNIQVPAGGAGAESTYEKEQRTVNNSVTKVTEQRRSAPGAVRKLNVAVLVNTTTGGSVAPAEVEALVSSAVGIDPERGDTIQVTRMPFDASAEQAAAAELAEAKAAEEAAARSNLLRTAGLVLLVLAVLGYAVLSGRRRTRKRQLTDEERIQLEQLQRALELQAAPSRPELDDATPAVAALEAPPPVDPELERLATARDEISEMVKNQPEEVAQLLRTWLADRRSS